MGQLLTSGEVGNIGLNQLKEARKSVIAKWDELGFLQGLNGHTRENVAQLFENQASYLIKEATTTDSTGSFETVVFPIVRRVFSKLLANDIVSVQALNLPIGKLFFFNPKISVRKADGSHYGPDYYPNSSPDDGGAGVQFETRSLYDAFYQDHEDGGLFDRTKGAYSTTTGTVTNVIWSGTSLVPGTESSGAKYQVIKLAGFTNTGAGHLVGPDGNEMDTEEFLSSLKVTAVAAVSCASGGTSYAAGGSVDFRVVTQQYTRGIVQYGTRPSPGSYRDVCDADGYIYLELDYSCPSCFDCDSPTGYVGAATVPAATGVTVTWRNYSDLEFEHEIAEVTFDLDSITVSVTERKLRATWSPEMAQDVSAFHNIDAEAELTALLSEQIAAEIDREILRDLRKASAWKLRWDYNGWRRNRSSGFTPYTQKDWNQTLITAINQISAQIHKSTLRGGANWIVVSSEISAIFDDLEYFHVSNAAPEEDQYNMGIEKIGALSGRYTVYRDPYAPANQILIGHKGKSLLDAGYIYAPYVPLQLTPVMYNPFTFAPVKGIMTRYAKKVVNNRYYGRIVVDGVRTFNINELR